MTVGCCMQSRSTNLCSVGHALPICYWIEEKVPMPLVRWSSWVPGSHWPQYFQCWGSCCVLNSDPKILGMLEHLEVVPPLGTMELSAVFKTKVDQHQPEGTRAAGQAGRLCPCSCCHRPLKIVLGQMLHSSH